MIKFIKLYNNMSICDLIDKSKINIGKITIKYDSMDDVIYCGELDDNNKPNGYGTGIFDKFKYCGLWINGEPNGEGIKYFTQNDNKAKIKYVGKFKGLTTLGNVTIYFNNKLYFYGNMINNQFTGLGKLYYINGKVKYDGNFKNNLNLSAVNRDP